MAGGYMVEPIPEMGDQRILPGILPNFAHSLTCGRYCLKALLRFHYEALLGARPIKAQLPKAQDEIKRIAAYDPYDDFDYSNELLEETLAPAPSTVEAWMKLLEQRGPIIVCGKGIGKARGVGHYILIIGVEKGNPSGMFSYLDPLRGSVTLRDDFKKIRDKIECRVSARADIGRSQARLDILQRLFST